MSGSLAVVPVTHAEANAFVQREHRHHGPTPGAKFCLAVAAGEDIVGVAIVGRPVARHLDDGWTLESEPDLHRWVPQRELDAVWRSMAGSAGAWASTAHHVHTGGRERGVAARCRLACSR